MKELHEFPSLAQAQAFDFPQDTKKVGSGQARGFFAQEGIWTQLHVIQRDIAHPLFALADAVIKTASDASSYFGMDEDKKEGKDNREGLKVFVAQGVMTQEQADKFIAMCLSVSYPYKNATQEDWDKAQLKAIATPQEVSYLGGDHVVVVSLARERYALEITIDEPLPFEDELIVTASSKTLSDDAIYAHNDSVRARVKVPANFTGTLLSNPVNFAGLSRHIKLYVKPTYARTLSAVTKSVL